MIRRYWKQFLSWLYAPLLDEYDLRLREYLKFKFEHTESEIECHDSRALSNLVHSCAEVRVEIQALRKELAEREPKEFT